MLFKLIVREDIEGLKAILKKEKNDLDQKDDFGDTPLYTACTDGNIEIVKILLKYPQNINEQCTGKYTSLHTAVQKRKFEIVKLLVKINSDVNIPNEFGNTPLMTAVDMFNGDDTIVKLLLKNGADPFIKNNYGVSVYKILEMPRNQSLKTLFPKEI